MQYEKNYFHFRSFHRSGNNGIINTVTFGSGYSTYQRRATDDIVERMCKMLRMNRIHPKENALFQFMLVPYQIKYHAYDFWKHNELHQRKAKLHSLVMPTKHKNPLYVRRYPSSVVIFQRNPTPNFYTMVSWCYDFALLDEANYMDGKAEKIRIMDEELSRSNMQVSEYVIGKK